MSKPHKQPIDRVAFLLMVILSVIILGLVLTARVYGIPPKVREFSWYSKEVGSQDIAFILTFDRQMQHETVIENLKINPPLLGKYSWAGRRLAFTLDTPIPYGENYQMKLENATDTQGRKIQPFKSQFRSRDRAFAYIGTRGDERGRLVLYNLTQKQKAIITPISLEVAEFKFYSSGDRILFSAADRNNGIDTIRNLKLYRLTVPKNTQTAPPVELLLDSNDYQNNEFDLSQDEESIIIERVNRRNATEFDLWLLKPNKDPQPLKVPGGQFLIAPDSQTLAIAQGEGVGLLPLSKDAKPLDFLPQFGQILNFSHDGRAAVFINFNRDRKDLSYFRSLYYVNNLGVSKELLKLPGSILNCQFNPQSTFLYCLLTKVTSAEKYQEVPYLVKIDIKNSKTIPLITLPDYRDIRLSLSPDGLGILFDQVITDTNSNIKDGLVTSSGEVILDSRLWLLIPPLDLELERSPQLQELAIGGIRPQWRP